MKIVDRLKIKIVYSSSFIAFYDYHVPLKRLPPVENVENTVKYFI